MIVSPANMFNLFSFFPCSLNIRERETSLLSIMELSMENTYFKDIYFEEHLRATAFEF